MNIEYRKFYTTHLRFLVPQMSQKYDHAVMLNSTYAGIIEANFAISMWADNVCIAASGVVPIFPHRAVAWALISGQARPYMRRIIRKMRASIALLPYKRIEIAVRADFEEGRRFARLLGMTLETPVPMLAHGATGEPELMYAVTK